MIVCELGKIPAISVPVVIREAKDQEAKQEEQEYNEQNDSDVSPTPKQL
jgi:hypothetical protein